MKKIALIAVSSIAMAAFPAAAKQVDTDPETEVTDTITEKSASDYSAETSAPADAASIDSKKSMADEPAPAPAPDIDDSDAAGEKKNA